MSKKKNYQKKFTFYGRNIHNLKRNKSEWIISCVLSLPQKLYRTNKEKEKENNTTGYERNYVKKLNSGILLCIWEI